MTDFERGKVEGLKAALAVAYTYGQKGHYTAIRSIESRIAELENAESIRARMGMKGEMR